MTGCHKAIGLPCQSPFCAVLTSNIFTTADIPSSTGIDRYKATTSIVTIIIPSSTLSPGRVLCYVRIAAAVLSMWLGTNLRSWCRIYSRRINTGVSGPSKAATTGRRGVFCLWVFGKP